MFFCFVYVIAWVFWKLLPDGPVKRKLFSSIYRKKPSRSPHWGTKKAEEIGVK